MDKTSRVDEITMQLLDTMSSDKSLPLKQREALSTAALMYQPSFQRVISPIMWALRLRILNLDVEWFSRPASMQAVSQQVTKICQDVGLTKEEESRVVQYLVPILSAFSFKAMQMMDRQVVYPGFGEVIGTAKMLVGEIARVNGEALVQGVDGLWR
jgi:hypothetical protein